jgi:hypothetical protein
MNPWWVLFFVIFCRIVCILPVKINNFRRQLYYFLSHTCSSWVRVLTQAFQVFYFCFNGETELAQTESHCEVSSKGKIFDKDTKWKLNCSERKNSPDTTFRALDEPVVILTVRTDEVTVRTLPNQTKIRIILCQTKPKWVHCQHATTLTKQTKVKIELCQTNQIWVHYQHAFKLEWV